MGIVDVHYLEVGFLGERNGIVPTNNKPWNVRATWWSVWTPTNLSVALAKIEDDYLGDHFTGKSSR